MIASKEYTAQEMRKKIKVLLGGLGNGVITMPSLESSREVADMLRQAAEMREMCEEVIADVNGPNSRFDYGIATPVFDANEIVDYILHGDAVKKEKK